MELKIKKVIVVTNPPNHMDTILLQVDLPEATWPYREGELILAINAAEGTGYEYCKKYLNYENKEKP